MSEDEVLSGAIEVFNSSVQGGATAGKGTGQSDTSGVLDNTASGTDTDGNTTGSGSSGQTAGTMTAGDGGGVSGEGSDGTGQGQQEIGGGTTGTGGMTDNGNGQSGTTTIIGGDVSALPTGSGTGTGIPARRIVVVDGGSGTMTDQERVETLDRELDESMGVFDGVILSRRQEVIARTNEEGAGQNGTGTAAGVITNADGSISPPLLTGGSGGNADSGRTTAGGMPDAQGGNRQGEYASAGSGNNANVPADISDGSDDDIVARQLREAAMQEKDPALREKLWDEYRKYKQGVQAKK